MCYLTKVDNIVIPTPDNVMHLQTHTTETQIFNTDHYLAGQALPVMVTDCPGLPLTG